MTVWYMNGAGNDFAVVDARDMNIDMVDTAKKLCKKRGCDGFMALDRSEIADFKLHFYNDDGSRAEMCGNGARCICRFAYDNGIAGSKMTVETDAGTVEGERISEDIYRIKMSGVKGLILDKEQGIDYVIVGVPHVAIEIKELDFADKDKLFERARKIRQEQNANVNFYSKIDENTIKNLTYERGVEGFTLACGTGSCAVAVILWSKGELKENALTVKNRGGDLKVIIDVIKDGINAVYLEGKAEVDGINNFEHQC